MPRAEKLSKWETVSRSRSAYLCSFISRHSHFHTCYPFVVSRKVIRKWLFFFFLIKPLLRAHTCTLSLPRALEHHSGGFTVWAVSLCSNRLYNCLQLILLLLKCVYKPKQCCVTSPEAERNWEVRDTIYSDLINFCVNSITWQECLFLILKMENLTNKSTSSYC